MILISSWGLDLAYSSRSHCSATSAHSISNCVQKSEKLSQDVIIYRKCGQLRWKVFRNLLAQSDFSLPAESKQRISTSILILNYNLLLSLQPALPVSQHCHHCLLSPPPPALLSFFHFVSCTSSVFKVQTTNAGCLSPEAVIDWLTTREGERERKTGTGEWTRAGREDALRACLNWRVYFCLSWSIIIGQKTPETHRMRWRMVSGGEYNRSRRKGQRVRFRLGRSPLIWCCRQKDWDADGPFPAVCSLKSVSWQPSLIFYCLMHEADIYPTWPLF